jgi:hypothetical protein
MEREGAEHKLRIVSSAQYRVLLATGGHERKPYCLTRTLPDGRMEIVFTRQEFDRLERIESEVLVETQGVSDAEMIEIVEPPTPMPTDNIPDADKQAAMKLGVDGGPLPNHPESSRRPSWFKAGFDPFGGR